MTTFDARRRRFLKTIGAGAAGLPFVRLLERSAFGAGGAAPMRLLLVCTGYGGRWSYLRPRGIAEIGDARQAVDVPLTPASIQFENAILAPLAPFASQMTIVEGVSLTDGLIPNGGGDRTLYVGHEGYAGAMWTGATVPRGKGLSGLPTGESIDYTLGQKLGGATAVRNVLLGAGCPVTPGTEVNASFTFNSAGQRLPGYSKPADAFKALFAGATGVPGAPAPANDMTSQLTLARDEKVIALVQKGARRVRARLGKVEQRKLDEHLAALADIEAHLKPSAGGGGTPVLPGVSCKEPVLPPAPTDITTSTAAQFGVIRQAFACDRTRFASMAWGIVGGPNPGILDFSIKDMHNQVAHMVGGSSPAAQAAELTMAQHQRWHAQQLADLMKQLAADQDANGTSVLDNTLIVWSTDFGQDVHGGLNVPYVLLGGGQKRFRMGRYLNVRRPKAPGVFGNGDGDWRSYEANNRLLISLLNGFGVQTDTYNSTEFPKALPGVLA